MPKAQAKPIADSPVYEVKMIHRFMDWDCTVSYRAPNSRKARQWAPKKMAESDKWLIVSAKRKVATSAEGKGGAS